MSNIEDDINRCKELIKKEHENWIGITNQVAIENVLADRERLIKENEELKDKLFDKISTKSLNDFQRKLDILDTDYIKKDKIIKLKEFYINSYKENKIELIPLSNLTKNINILLEDK